MDHLHPLIVHFPIVLLVVWPAIDALGLALGRPDVCRVAAGLLLLAIPCSLAATLSGQSAYDAAIAAGVLPALLDTHADLANPIPWLVVAVAVARLVGARRLGLRGQIIGLVLGVALAGLVLSAGRSGGALVFDHGVGVAR